MLGSQYSRLSDHLAQGKTRLSNSYRNLSDCRNPSLSTQDQVGGPLPHGVYQTGNALKIPKAKMSDAGNYICTAQNQFGMGRSPDARLDVTRREWDEDGRLRR